MDSLAGRWSLVKKGLPVGSVERCRLAAISIKAERGRTIVPRSLMWSA